jgi:hypothetical protein
MAKTLIMKMYFDLPPTLDDAQIELMKHLYLAGMPPTMRDRIAFEVEEARPPQHAERMMECVRKEFTKYDNRHTYRPKFYGKITGEQ